MGEMLRCRAENPVMPASQIEDTWSLDINCECRSPLAKTKLSPVGVLARLIAMPHYRDSHILNPTISIA